MAIVNDSLCCAFESAQIGSGVLLVLGRIFLGGKFHTRKVRLNLEIAVKAKRIEEFEHIICSVHPTG